MSKHTPGPWEFLGDADDFECRVRQKSSVKKGPGFISEITICENIGNTQNARLIAAAPDLLEAIEALERIKDIWLPDVAEDQHQEEMIVLHKARTIMLAAIAKAKGK